MSLLKDGIQTKYPEGVILFELRTPTAELFVVSTDPDTEYFNEFIFIWGDYVANVWEEKYELLSQATARMAQLIHCVAFKRSLGAYSKLVRNFFHIQNRLYNLPSSTNSNG